MKALLFILLLFFLFCNDKNENERSILLYHAIHNNNLININTNIDIGLPEGIDTIEYPEIYYPMKGE